MARQRHKETDTSSSTTTLIALVVGGLVVAALVVWALTRSVESPATTASIGTPTSTDLPAVSPPADTTPLTATSGTSPFTASTAAPEDVEAQKAAEKRISAEDLHEKFNAKSVTIIDVRDATSYASGHIPGAINIPLASIQSYLDMIPKGKEIVTYCT